MIANQLASSAPYTRDVVMDALSLTTTTTAAADLDAAITALAASGADMRSCSHGSRIDHFQDGIAYRDVVHAYLAEGSTKGKTEIINGRSDLNFAHYIFALCTLWYLKTNTVTPDMKKLLNMAVMIKYIEAPEQIDLEKFDRYNDAIRYNGERGIINCLSRETKPFCDCMKGKKKEAKGMAKMELCCGCLNYFPRTSMTECSGCTKVMFCSIECQTNAWPAHRERCHQSQIVHAAFRELEQKEQEQQTPVGLEHNNVHEQNEQPKKKTAFRELTQDEKAYVCTGIYGAGIYGGRGLKK